MQHFFMIGIPVKTFNKIWTSGFILMQHILIDFRTFKTIPEHKDHYFIIECNADRESMIPWWCHTGHAGPLAGQLVCRTGCLVFTSCFKVSLQSGSEERKCFLKAVNTGLIYDLCRVSRWRPLFFFSLQAEKCVPHLHQRWVKSYLFELLATCRFMRVGAEGPRRQRLIHSDTGWRFSRCADVFRHTCAGDRGAFQVVTFLLWKYPFSCETALSAPICQEAIQTAWDLQLQHLEEQQAELSSSGIPASKLLHS